MSQFTTRLEVTPLSDGRKWKVIRTFRYDVGHLGSGTTITIPAGFVTDFASSPRLFWPVVSPWGKWGEAAIVHDWLYREKKVTRHSPYGTALGAVSVSSRSVTRKRADDIFLEAMTVLGVAPWRRKLMYFGVRAFGWLAWK